MMCPFSKFVVTYICIALPFVLEAQQQKTVKISHATDFIVIENELIAFKFGISSGTYSAINKTDNSECLSNACYQVGQTSSNFPGLKCSWQQEVVNDELGSGLKLIIKTEQIGNVAIILAVTLYSGKPFIILGSGIKNLSGKPIQCRNISPFIGKAFRGFQINDGFYTLDGNGGGEKTEVNSNKLRHCRNNLLSTFGKGEKRRSIVLGGLTYHEFEKYVTVQEENTELQICLYGYDPVGKRVDPGQTYFPDDRFFIDFFTSNQFESLENYALSIKLAQKINLNQYDFPTVCLWYAGAENYGGGAKNNNSKGAVEETKLISNSGFLNYSRAAVRLVPDNYDNNNQQGWWDDNHFQKLSNTSSNEAFCYVSPYETTEKWCKEVTKLGGLPFIYCQTAKRSEDYCLAHPDHMLFNQSHALSNTRTLANEAWWFGTTQPLMWGYDFTDTGFVRHMQDVYSNYRRAGIKGIMFDYPSTAWDYEGGFEDPYATTASAYRDVFRLAYEGLGTDSYINERNLERGSDITLGVVTSQRAWGDTDFENPLMVSRGGLRWYKNRVVINYDLDSKNPNHCNPNNRDGQRSMLTMSYVTTGRLILGISFSKLTKEQLSDISRIYPFHTQPKSARPLDAFSGKKFPQIYDFQINKAWHQLTLYNSALDNYDCEFPWYGGSDCELKGNPVASTIEVDLSLPQADGGLGLDADKSYYMFDFWNDLFLGKISAKDKLVQNLRAGEARMISIHEVENFPQFISTNRHIMQGYLDMDKCEFKHKTNKLEGRSKVIGNETYKVIIAANNYKLNKCDVSSGKVKVMNRPDGLIEIDIDNTENKEVDWSVSFISEKKLKTQD